MRQEVEQKGIQYAREADINWSISQQKNPMTDQIDVRVKSIQKNELGVIAEIDGKCLKPGVVEFSALVVDENGKPTLGFPQYTGQAVVGTLRINSDPASQFRFLNEEFHNNFVILVLTGNGTAAQGNWNFQTAESTWRVLAEIQTNQGPVFIKIPLFEKNVRKLVEGCVGGQ